MPIDFGRGYADSGGIVADFPADFFSPEETLALVPQAVIQAFAEQLNTPLLMAAEQAATPNLLEAFEEKRQYLAWHLDYYGYVPGKMNMRWSPC